MTKYRKCSLVRRLLAMCLVLTFLSGCASKADQSQPAAEGTESYVPADISPHKLGVIVYNTQNDEVQGFRSYLEDYIAANFEMVSFVYSGSISSKEEELDFIRKACDDGVEGFLSFLSHDLEAEVALCEERGAYYLLASGTVSSEAFEAVEDNPWFLGIFGPGKPFEFEAGADMARYFIREKTGNRYFIMSGGAAVGNEMHYQRTLGMLDTIANAYGVSFSLPREEMAASEDPVTEQNERVTVTVCPGYVRFPESLEIIRQSFTGGEYDAVMSVLAPDDAVDFIGKTPLGIVDSYNTRNLQLFASGPLCFVEGKYNSMIGPAFALMLNAVTGYAEDFRDDGKAIAVTQGFWVAEGREDYNEKYALSTSAAMNAYNFDDLAAVIRIYNPEANLNDLCALAEACSYRAVQARRSRDQ